MTIKEALIKAIEKLKIFNIETPVIDAGVMLCNVINREKAYIYAHGEEILSQADEGRYMQMILRRANGEPVQYIVGHQEFMGLDFTVNSDVLVPRADTEILVESIIKYVECEYTDNSKVDILDIGTGSGCIAISLAHYISNASITAIDISKKALDVAMTNSVKLGTGEKLEFVLSNLFENLNKDKEYDIIVSNPPYIPAKDIRDLQVEVREYEPILALDGGLDGLDFYRSIVTQGKAFIKKGGIMAFEVGFNQAEAVVEIMKPDFCSIQIIKDLSKINRVIMGLVIK